MADNKLTDAQKTSIMKLFFERVKTKARRERTIKLALFLSDEGVNEEEFYSAMYDYALEENWEQAKLDYAEFRLDGYAPDASDTLERLGLEPTPRRKRRPVPPKKKKK